MSRAINPVNNRYFIRQLQSIFKLQQVCCNISTSKSENGGMRPRRSLLYVPGNEEKKVRKAASLPADVVVLDCEDGVAISMKEEARSSICRLLPQLDFDASESVVRINSADTMYAEEDLREVLTSELLPQALMLPKVESADQFKWLKSATTKHLADSNRTSTKLKLIAQCETPKGMMDLREILTEGCADHDNIKLEAFVFGSDDYLASIGATRTKDARELLFARQYFIMHVKGFGLQAIDLVDIDFKDLNGLEKQSDEGSRMGFTGKQVIHPAQISVVNSAFSPSAARIQYAAELVEAFEQHQSTGKGAFSFRGNMIDMPSVKQAQNILNLANMIES